MFTQKQIMKRKLVKAFRAGELHLTYKNGQTTQLIMPKIHAVQILEAGVRYVFTVPLGLNPSDVESKLWLFHAQFGENIELFRANKQFTLSVYTSSLPNALTYDYEAILPSLKGLRVPIVCGKGRTNKYFSYDLTEHPHLLLAGTTGSGKSTQLRSVLSTLIKHMAPDHLEMYLGDLKRSEFHAFRNIAHVKSVSTRVEELAVILAKVDKEMKRRGDLLDKHEETHTHDLPEDVRPPYLIVCIDEVVLLKKEKKLMKTIEDISSIGRALGVFLILSMQRGDADVLDGKLKNNLTVRMGFRHTDGVNSRITGTPGAEDISRSTPGRFLLKLDELTELQSPYLTLPEAKLLLKPFKVEIIKENILNEEKTSNEVVSDEPISIFGVLEDE
ncbi:FtsK/SpoIIIE domain-containing protein [Alkalihalobacillus sp. FSL R5-0424]